MNPANSTPPSVAAVLEKMDRAERRSRFVPFIYAALAVCVPFLLLLRTAVVPWYELAIAVLLLYNTLYLVWVKHDVNSNAARMFRLLTHLGVNVRQLQDQAERR